MKEFALINAKIVTSKEIFEGFVCVKDSKTTEVGRGKYSGKLTAQDLQGKHLLPGLIDVHVHFRTPGGTQKEDWTTGSRAALAGGVTTVLDMPNTNPPTVDLASLEEKRKLVREQALVNYGFFAGATRGNLQDLREIKGVAGIKVYMGSSTGNLLVDDLETLEKLMKDSGKLLALHAETESCIQKGFHDHEGQTDPAVHSQIRAPECAADAVKHALHLAKKHGAQVHLCHVSTEKELEIARKFKSERVSVEVTPHHLFLSDAAYAEQGNLVKVNPPLREERDRLALWEGIKDGTVTMIATDHAPHLLEEKELPYAQVPSGVPGVQTMLPLLLNAVNEGKLTLERVVELCAQNPARRFGIKGKGAIAVGMDADFTVVDLDLKEKVCHHFLWSKANWSPFHGWVLRGWPVMTFVGGELMYEWRERFGNALGREVSCAVRL